MPEISVASALPAVPAAAPIAGIAAPVALQPVDSAQTAQTFLTQLKAALASLTSVVAPQQPQVAMLAQAPAADAPVAPTGLDAEAAKPADHQSDVLPELLAALGFTLVPPTFQPPAEVHTTDTGGDVSAAQVQVPTAQMPAAQPETAQPATSAAHAAAADTLPAQSAAHAPTTTGDHPSTQSAIAEPAHSPDHAPASAAQSTAPIATTPTTATTPAAPLANSAVPTDTNAAQQAQPPVQHRDTTAAPGQATAAPVISAGSGQSAQQGSTFQDSGTGHGESKTPSHKATSVADAASVQGTTSTDQLAVSSQAAAAATAPVAGAPQPQPAQVAQVVNQIAHQADLYRLPGNRGVRIQLHPDDLGGVQVTVKYAASGGIELHINAEHASTGALVQAGWTQLRDALATQGISPDRLVMSVTAPSSASQMDFSSNTGQNGYRSDAGAAGFNQGGQGQGQPRQDGDDQRVARPGWTGGPNQKSNDDNTARTTSVGASTRIDYRV